MNRRLADDRPAAGLAGVGATGDVSGVTNARVSGDPACPYTGLCGDLACPAGLTGDLAPSVLTTCSSCSCWFRS